MSIVTLSVPISTSLPWTFYFERGLASWSSRVRCKEHEANRGYNISLESILNDQEQHYCSLPLAWVGPVKFLGENELDFEAKVPLATYESPIWHAVERGARLSTYAPIETHLISSAMARSVLLRARSLKEAKELARRLSNDEVPLAHWTERTSRYCKFHALHVELMGSLIWLRLSFTTAAAAGHNMVTKAATAIARELCAASRVEGEPSLAVVSDSGNLCCDKKVSSANALLGRGIHVQAQIELEERLIRRFLRCDPEALYRVCLEKNWYGSTLGGSLHSANAHVANILLAFYLATGQDGANIVEGSQAQSMVEWAETKGTLRFTCRLPHIIVGTVGVGKEHEARLRLEALGCGAQEGSKERLAQIIAATVLCGELSLLGALTRPGELIASHEKIERQQVYPSKCIPTRGGTHE